MPRVLIPTQTRSVEEDPVAAQHKQAHPGTGASTL